MKPRADVLLIPALLCLSTSVMEVPIKLQMKAMGQLKEPSYRIVFYFCLLGLVFSLVGTLMTSGFHCGDTTDSLCLFAMVILGTAGQYFLTRSYAYGNVLLSACLSFSAIPISAFIGWIAFNEITNLMSLVGMMIIIAVGIFATIHTSSEESKETTKN